jgi:AraC-like DNA-binding protein
MVGNQACRVVDGLRATLHVRAADPSELRSLPADQCRISDPVLTALGEVLIPALEQGMEQPLVSRVLRLMNVHLSNGIESSSAISEPIRHGLAPWQERRTKEFLMEHFADNVAIADVAAICKLSRSHFTRAFKISTRRTPREWLLRYRVQRAQEWLLGSSSIAEIAARCGFVDQSHFTTVFKKFTGLAPGKYRRRNRI